MEEIKDLQDRFEKNIKILLDFIEEEIKLNNELDIKEFGFVEYRASMFKNLKNIVNHHAETTKAMFNNAIIIKDGEPPWN